MGSRTSTGAFRACLAVAAAAALAVPAQTRAGVYHVFSCRTPAGELAPVDGWSAYGHGATAVAENTCASPTGGLLAAFIESEVGATEGDAAGWQFRPPAPERLVAARLWRAGDVDGGFTTKTRYELWLGGSSRSSAFDACVASEGCTTGRGDQADPLASANLVSAPPATLGEGVSANVACSGYALGCPGPVLPPLTDGYDARLVLFAADLTLEQEAAPTVADVGGELATASTVSGKSALTFTARDAGAGVYQALVSVDGTLLERTSLDANGGRCRDVGGTTDGSAAFVYLQPCASTVSSSLALDTASLSNGPHHVQVSVMDAAGNSALVLDRTVTVTNGPPCAAVSPSPAGAVLNAAWKGTSATTLTGGFAHAHVIAGTLSHADGTPIPGASIEAFGVSGGSAVLAITDAFGHFSLRVPGGGPSRALCLAYRGSPVGALTTRELRLSVRAPVALAIAPRTVSVGGTIRFRGRLLGGHVPAGGKPVILEARSSGSGWLEFKVVRSDARGRFHARYRFRFPGPATYEFRVLCEAEADYPFARGASNIVRVHER